MRIAAEPCLSRCTQYQRTGNVWPKINVTPLRICYEPRLLGAVPLHGGYGTLDIALLAGRAHPGPIVWTAGVLVTVGLLEKTALVINGSRLLVVLLWLDVLPGGVPFLIQSRQPAGTGPLAEDHAVCTLVIEGMPVVQWTCSARNVRFVVALQSPWRHRQYAQDCN